MRGFEMSVTLQVRQDVEDYEGWKPAFHGHELTRRQHGATGHRVLREGNSLTVLVDFPDEESAQGFISDPTLREAMAKGGVIGAPSVEIVSSVEEVHY